MKSLYAILAAGAATNKFKDVSRAKIPLKINILCGKPCVGSCRPWTKFASETGRLLNLVLFVRRLRILVTSYLIATWLFSFGVVFFRGWMLHGLQLPSLICDPLLGP